MMFSEYINQLWWKFAFYNDFNHFIVKKTIPQWIIYKINTTILAISLKPRCTTVLTVKHKSLKMWQLLYQFLMTQLCRTFMIILWTVNQFEKKILRI